MSELPLIFVFVWIYIVVPALILFSPDCKTAIFIQYIFVIAVLFMVLTIGNAEN